MSQVIETTRGRLDPYFLNLTSASNTFPSHQEQIQLHPSSKAINHHLWRCMQMHVVGELQPLLVDAHHLGRVVGSTPKALFQLMFLTLIKNPCHYPVWIEMNQPNIPIPIKANSH